MFVNSWKLFESIEKIDNKYDLNRYSYLAMILNSNEK